MIDPVVVSQGAVSNPTLHQGMTAVDAAKEFESMLIAAWMKTAREAGEIDEQEDEMTGADSYLEFAEKYVAEAIADSNVFGFSKLMSDELNRHADRKPDGGVKISV